MVKEIVCKRCNETSECHYGYYSKEGYMIVENVCPGQTQDLDIWEEGELKELDEDEF